MKDNNKYNNENKNIFSRALGAHGANPEKLYKALNIKMPERVIDFSTNASVMPWNNDNINIKNFNWLDLAAHYPDYECLALRNLIAERENLNIKNILFVNGTNEAFYIIASYLMNKRAAILQPAYSEYERALKSYKAEIFDIFNIFNINNNFDAVFFSNPSNPTGGYIEPDDLINLINKNKDTLFVIDEAYIDFLLSGESARFDFNNKNIIILRSLTKFYHLSGLRIGYVLANHAIIEKLKARQPTWSVNSAAQALAISFLNDKDFAEKSLNFYKSQTPKFINNLTEIGFEICPSRTNFFLIKLNNISDEIFITHMLKRGVVVRHTRNFKGLDGKYIRVATRLPEENEFFVSTASELKYNV